MCTPSTVMTGISVLGSALGMASSLSNQSRQARAQAKAQERENAQALENAKIAEREARQALADGEKDKEKIRLEQKALQAQKVAEYGAGNIDLAGGSPLIVLGDMARDGENQALDAGEKARRQAQGYKEQANNYYRQMGSVQAQNPFQAASTVFSGLESIGKSFGDFDSANADNKATKSAKPAVSIATPLTAKNKRGANYF